MLFSALFRSAGRRISEDFFIASVSGELTSLRSQIVTLGRISVENLVVLKRLVFLRLIFGHFLFNFRVRKERGSEF